mgnify:CR=1 FL=1
MTQNIITRKKIVIVGLGKTGLSCARHLHQSNNEIMVMDSRPTPPGVADLKELFPAVKFVLGAFDKDILCQADEIILSPGVPLSNGAIQEAKKKGVKVRGDIDLFAEVANAPIIAITGSNGKSTVTTLLGDMAKQAGWDVGVGGNLGVPALDLLANERQLYILELSSFQLETTEKLAAHSAIILNISEDHMDRYPEKISYLQAKQRIFRGAKHVVVNDDEVLSNPVAASVMKLTHFGLGDAEQSTFSVIEASGERYLAKGYDTLLNIKELKVKGEHNLSNCLAAMALASTVGLSQDAVLGALRTFEGLAHRCQFVRKINGIEFINDSKATNPGAVATAINSLGKSCSGKIILIAGGESKQADLSPLKKVMNQFGKSAVLIGSDADLFVEIFKGIISNTKASTLAAALVEAYQQAKEGDIVLLSPACASFDMFENYEHRGDMFIEEVLKL